MKKIKIIIIILLQIYIVLIEYNLYQNITNYKVEKENNKVLKQEVKEYKNTESNYKQTEEKIKSVFNETDVNKLKENVKNEEQENTTLKETIFSKEEIKSNLETENNTLNNQHKVLLKKKKEICKSYARSAKKGEIIFWEVFLCQAFNFKKQLQNFFQR